MRHKHATPYVKTSLMKRQVDGHVTMKALAARSSYYTLLQRCVGIVNLSAKHAYTSGNAKGQYLLILQVSISQ